MITRKVYRAQLTEVSAASLEEIKGKGVSSCNELVEREQLMTVSLYRWERNIFLYYECISHELRPESILPGLEEFLAAWPGTAEQRFWVPMIDVFHFNEPVGKEHWQRNKAVDRRVGKVAHLKPDMVASYIYYHYQLQEERAFPGDKYKIIFLHENLLFGYTELPEVLEEPLTRKKLETSGTPVNWADAHMDQHFSPWDDGTIFFKDIEPVFPI